GRVAEIDQPERRRRGGELFQDRHADVVDGDVTARPPLELAAVRMAVEHDAHRISQERLLEAARSGEGEDLGRLAVARRLDRRVVQNRDTPGAPQAGEGRLELQRLVQGLAHELLEERLAPRLERVLSEPAAEPLGAGEADALDLAGVAVEQVHARLAEDGLDL